MDKEKLIGVYRIKLPGNRFYIGMTSNSFKGRWSGHKSKLFNNTHPNKALQNIYNKYGKDSLKFEIIEAYSKPTNKGDLKNFREYLLEREYFIWSAYKNNSMTVINSDPKSGGHMSKSDEFYQKINEERMKTRISKIYLDYCKYIECNKYFSRKRKNDSKFCSEDCANKSIKSGVKKRMSKLPEDSKIIEELYCKANLSPLEISKIYKCSQQTVRNYMKRNNIPIRTLSEANVLRHSKNK